MKAMTKAREISLRNVIFHLGQKIFMSSGCSLTVMYGVYHIQALFWASERKQQQKKASAKCLLFELLPWISASFVP